MEYEDVFVVPQIISPILHWGQLREDTVKLRQPDLPNFQGEQIQDETEDVESAYDDGEEWRTAIQVSPLGSLARR